MSQKWVGSTEENWRNLFEDLKRRDFTINAMALSSSGELIDSFNGQNDLSKKTVRAVGNPNKRFSEDALRILRAFRFSARLNFEIEEAIRGPGPRSNPELKYKRKR